MPGGDFSWQLGAASGGNTRGSRWSIWGRGDLGIFEGRPDSGSGYDGESRTGWLGVDARDGPWVAGLAVSRGTSEADYHSGSGTTTAQSGRLQVELTALYPYVRWAFANGMELQALMGAGSGDVRHFPDGSAREHADLEMRLGSLGMRGPPLELAGLEINARADLGFVRMDTEDGGEAVHGLRADAWRARFGLEASRRIVVAQDSELVPFLEVASRQDGGDGVEGTGAEVTGGARYVGGRFRLEARGRVLAQHSAEGADERGMSLTARLAPRPDGGGLSLALTPRWGRPAGLTEALWQHEVPRATDSVGVGTALLDARAGYGFLLRRGLLTPFTEASLASDDSRVLRVGVRFEAVGTHLYTQLLGERQEYGNADTGHGLRIDLRIGF